MLTRELAMEARAAQPGDRTRTAEEMAEAERQRLERLERERQRRMAAAGDDEEEDEGPDDLNKKGFAGRRARMDAAEERRERKLKRKVMESGDALDDEDFEAGSGSEGEEGSEGGSGDEDEDDEDMVRPTMKLKNGAQNFLVSQESIGLNPIVALSCTQPKLISCLAARSQDGPRAPPARPCRGRPSPSGGLP